MARYIDADKALKFIKKTNANYHWLLSQYSASWVYDFIESQPFADVVPRAEYEQLQRKYELAVAEREANVKGFAEDIAKAKSEIAKKICCEIEEEIVAALESNYEALRTHDDGRNNDYIIELVGRIKGKIDALRGIEAFVEELEKEYTKGDEGE